MQAVGLEWVVLLVVRSVLMSSCAWAADVDTRALHVMLKPRPWLGGSSWILRAPSARGRPRAPPPQGRTAEAREDHPPLRRPLCHPLIPRQPAHTQAVSLTGSELLHLTLIRFPHLAVCVLTACSADNPAGRPSDDLQRR